MKAIVRKGFGGPEVLEVVDVPEPSVRPGCVLIRVRAFGLNRAELYSVAACGERWPTSAASNVLGPLFRMRRVFSEKVERSWR